MKVLEDEEIIERDAARASLSKLRYTAQSSKRISEATLWRWCNLAKIPSGIKQFDFEQIARLARIARLAKRGHSYKQIQEHLEGDINNGKSNRRSRVHAEPEQSSPFNFSSFFGSRTNGSN